MRVTGLQTREVLRRSAAALQAHRERLTELDGAMGDGDLGITAGKVAAALEEHAAAAAESGDDEDVGAFLMSAGMAANRAAASTMGTLLATMLLRAGKTVKGKAELTREDLAAMARAAEAGVRERGKAKLGDKTIVDALHPAAEAFAGALEAGSSPAQAAREALAAAERGRDEVTPKRSRIGRASWVGERTEGRVDPGCELLVLVLRSLVEAPGDDPDGA